jgi:hypothetical protein
MNSLSLFCSSVVKAAVVAVSAAATAVAGGAAGSPPRAATCPSCGHNLISNPGAEAAAGAGADVVVKVPGWAPTNGFTAAQYVWSGGDISPTSRGPAARGKNYFYGGPDAAMSTGTQVTKIAGGEVSTGKVSYKLSGWLGGYSSQEDDAWLTATFEKKSGAAISSVTIGPVTEAQRKDVSELLFRQKAGKVPAATAKVSLVLTMRRYQGSDDDGLADNLSLVFTAPTTSQSGHAWE